jgi:hypothetical protein
VLALNGHEAIAESSVPDSCARNVSEPCDGCGVCD